MFTIKDSLRQILILVAFFAVCNQAAENVAAIVNQVDNSQITVPPQTFLQPLQLNATRKQMFEQILKEQLNAQKTQASPGGFMPMVNVERPNNGSHDVNVHVP